PLTPSVTATMNRGRAQLFTPRCIPTSENLNKPAPRRRGLLVLRLVDSQAQARSAEMAAVRICHVATQRGYTLAPTPSHAATRSCSQRPCGGAGLLFCFALLPPGGIDVHVRRAGRWRRCA